MSFLTPAYPLDASLLDASRATPDASPPAAAPTPTVFGGVLRSGSPFLDATPFDVMLPMDGMVYLPLPPVAPDPVETADAKTDAPFDRAAVARACARAARAVEHVDATVMSDDGVAEHVCDVAPWLAAATVREIDALARAGWAGDEAEEVAAAVAEDDPEVADVLRHARRTDAGVVVEIDGTAAMAWLARHRPAIAGALGDESADAPEDGADIGSDED